MPPERRAWEPDPLFSGQLSMPGAAPRRLKAAEAAPMPPERRAWEPDPLFSGQDALSLRKLFLDKIYAAVATPPRICAMRWFKLASSALGWMAEIGPSGSRRPEITVTCCTGKSCMVLANASTSPPNFSMT